MSTTQVTSIRCQMMRKRERKKKREDAGAADAFVSAGIKIRIKEEKDSDDRRTEERFSSLSTETDFSHLKRVNEQE